MNALLSVLEAAANGAFPKVDGGVSYHPPFDDGMEVVLSFTGHALLATRLSPKDLAEFDPDGFGAALHPSVLMRMAGANGSIGVIDATLVAEGLGDGEIAERDDLDDHPRVQYARSLRRDVTVFGNDHGLVTMGSGLAGRTEMSVELFETSWSGGRGRHLISEALRRAPKGAPVFAAVSPGNARSLRAFLVCGFTPIGSEVIIRPG